MRAVLNKESCSRITVMNIISNGLQQHNEWLWQFSAWYKIAALDPKDKKIHKMAKDVEVGFGTRVAVKEALERKDVIDGDVLKMKHECVTFLSVTLAKILEKCPLKYSIVRNMACLNPTKMVTDASMSCKRFEKVLESLMSAGWLSPAQCDDILAQYKTYVREMSSPARGDRGDFAEFDPSNARVDVFFRDHSMQEDRFAKLWQTVKLLLTLYHGQADVERGYSVNKALLRDNMAEKTVVSLRTVHDAVTSRFGGNCCLLTPNPTLKRHMRAARNRYHEYLESKRADEASEAQAVERKRRRDQIRELEVKRAKLEKTYDALLDEADSTATKAEREESIFLLSKSNAMRKQAKDVKQRCIALEDKLKDLDK